MAPSAAVSQSHPGEAVASPPRHDTPVLVLNTAVVAQRYVELRSALPGVDLHFAVKANPAPVVLQVLARLGCRWDVASPGEIDAALEAGGDAAHLSYGNTIKKAADIAYAVRRGVRRFTVDSPAELTKIVTLAHGATVLVRLATSGAGAEWALGRKFGCSEVEATALLARAHRAGHPVGIGFHVGSQQHEPTAWDEPLATAARLRAGLRRAGAELSVVDLGGGFPAALLGEVPPIGAYGAAIAASIRRHFGTDVPALMAEPGRALVADAGALESEVVLVSTRAGSRWVYLDVGLFSGLVEAYAESVKYRLEVRRNGKELHGVLGPAILAGPTCDSLDILYQRHRYQLPMDLRPGDRVRFLSAGAYTASYSSVGFNGFAPLREEYR